MTKAQKRRLILLGIVSVAAGVVAAVLVPKPPPEVSRIEFLAEVRAGHVQKITIDDDVIVAVSTMRGKFRTPLQPDEKPLLDELRARGVEILYATPGLGV